MLLSQHADQWLVNQFKNSFAIDLSKPTSVLKGSMVKQVHYIQWKLFDMKAFSRSQTSCPLVSARGERKRSFCQLSYLRKSSENIPRCYETLLEDSQSKNDTRYDEWDQEAHCPPFMKQVAGEQKYHPECFTCVRCEMFIGDGDSYILVEHTKLYW